MKKTRILIANRGEIAKRISRTVSDMGMHSIAIYAQDDNKSSHVSVANESVALEGIGPAAYLDADQIVNLAIENECDLLHPGYGFLSESAAFAAKCQAVGVTFVGPDPNTLELFGNKVSARILAEASDVPVLAGTSSAESVEDAKEFFRSLPEHSKMLIKAVSGGGGRGMRIVEKQDEISAALDRCRSEAQKSFGDSSIYLEQYLDNARHVEIQVVGDGSGVVASLGERECSVQRRHQKIIEMSPAPNINDDLRSTLTRAALRLAESAKLRGLCTIEFLIDGAERSKFPFAFIEANPRLQVEHTVTEEVYQVDLVQLQIQIAQGKSLEQLNLAKGVAPTLTRQALQLRINMETINQDGQLMPSSGQLTTFDPPTGRGVRVDTHGYTGWEASPLYDSLLAKVIVSSPCETDFPSFVDRSKRILNEFRVVGIDTSIEFLKAILSHPEFKKGHFDTTFVDQNIEELVSTANEAANNIVDRRKSHGGISEGLSLERSESLNGSRSGTDGEDFDILVVSPIAGKLLSYELEVGAIVAKGQPIAVVEAMKMEHIITAKSSGVIESFPKKAGEIVTVNEILAYLNPSDESSELTNIENAQDLDYIRPDLEEVHERHRLTTDSARPRAVEKRRRTNQRTARENIDDLLQGGNFIEYGPLVVAAQRTKRDFNDLIRETPADGLISGIGEVNLGLVPKEKSKCAIISYDYTVMAGTQGYAGHLKTDRIIGVAKKQKLPLMIFTEGGGGRPGDTDFYRLGGMDCDTFSEFASLSGFVPLVGINSGYCFAGNASLLGCCDVIIATKNSSIGMGGPAMIEGGNLGVFTPGEVGPVDVQVPNGVIDILAEDEKEAVDFARKYISYFQGPTVHFECNDQRKLRHLIPENRKRIYNVRDVVKCLADKESVLELRSEFGLGMMTAFTRFAGRTVGIVANNPTYLAGAVDSDGADKASRFMKLCDAFDIPILTLIDTPGIMVGPESEKTGTVRHANRLMLAGANLTVPVFSVVLRKSYGLGAIAMATASFKNPVFVVSWPTGEFGGMGLEGRVRLGHRKLLEEIDDPVERERVFQRLVGEAYKNGRALNVATHTEIDDVIDPFETRDWILNGLDTTTTPKSRLQKKYPFVDSW